MDFHLEDKDTRLQCYLLRLLYNDYEDLPDHRVTPVLVPEFLRLLKGSQRHSSFFVHAILLHSRHHLLPATEIFHWVLSIPASKLYQVSTHLTNEVRQAGDR